MPLHGNYKSISYTNLCLTPLVIYLIMLAHYSTLHFNDATLENHRMNLKLSQFFINICSLLFLSYSNDVIQQAPINIFKK